MKWYVNRNGETVGPIESKQVDQWIKDGMTDAWVMSDAGGNWMPVKQSPFWKEENRKGYLALLFLVALLAWGGYSVYSFATWDPKAHETADERKMREAAEKTAEAMKNLYKQ